MEPVDRKSDLIRRIAAALRGREDAESSAAPAPAAAAGPATEARIARFRELFEEQGGRFLSGPALEPLLPVLAEALGLAGVTALLYPEDDPGARRTAEALVPFGPFRLASPGDVRQVSPPPVAGVQTAEWAIAETGTIVQSSRGGKTLLPGLLTDVHVVLLTPAMFVDGLEDALAVFADDPPRNISFISGPSRSADIEQTLTVGAHGPKAVIAVLLP